jgi:hypothetical protein
VHFKVCVALTKRFSLFSTILQLQNVAKSEDNNPFTNQCERGLYLTIIIGLWSWCLTPLSTIFQLYCRGQFYNILQPNLHLYSKPVFLLRSTKTNYKNLTMCILKCVLLLLNVFLCFQQFYSYRTSFIILYSQICLYIANHYL